MRVTIISPEASMFDGEAEAVTAPAFQFLPAHAPIRQAPMRLLTRIASCASKSRACVMDSSRQAMPCFAAAVMMRARVTPATPQRESSGVTRVLFSTMKRLLMVPPMTWSCASSTIPSGTAGSLHSPRAITFSRRLRCFTPASRGWNESRVAQRWAVIPERLNSAG